MAENPAPYLFPLQSIGAPEIGYLSVAEPFSNIPFEIKRVFWSYYTPQMITRGRHAHHQLQQVLVAVTGKIVVTCETQDGTTDVFVLEDPNMGLYIPPMYWHVMQFSHNAVMLSLASIQYNEKDYIRDYDEFRK